jgi:hypothetical protein
MKIACGWLSLGVIGIVLIGMLGLVPVATANTGGTTPMAGPEEPDSPINETWNRTYNNTQTAVASGQYGTGGWNLTYSMDFYDVAETASGEYAFAGSVGTWDPNVDWTHEDGLLLRTDTDGNVSRQGLYGGSAPSRVERRLGCWDPDEGNLPPLDAPEPPVVPFVTLEEVYFSTRSCAVVYQNPNPRDDDKSPFVEFEDGTPELFRLEDEVYGSYEDPSSDYHDTLSALAETPEGGFVIAGTSNTHPRPEGVFEVGMDFTPWLVKTDASGEAVWNRTYQRGVPGGFNEVIATSDGGVLAVGESATFGGSEDVWLMKTNATGDVQWSNGYGGPEREGAYDVVETSNGNYAVAGETFSNTRRTGHNDAWLLVVNESGGVELNRTYSAGGRFDVSFDSATAIVEQSDDGFVIGGSTTAFSEEGDDDAWLFRTDANGEMQWNRTYGASDETGSGHHEVVGDLVEAHDGGFVFAGDAEADALTDQQTSTWLVGTNATGAELWNETITVGRLNKPHHLIRTSDGEYVVTLRQTGTRWANLTDYPYGTQDLEEQSRAIKFDVRKDGDETGSAGFDPDDYDTDGDGTVEGDLTGVLQALADYNNGAITFQQLLQVIAAYNSS